MSRSAPRPVALALLALAAVSLGGAGCASGKAAKKVDIFWPLPPEKPRIRFVRAFQSEDDLAAGGIGQALRALVPSSPDEVVAQPTGLAVTPDGKFLYVACPSVGRILKVDLAAGRMSLTAAEEGSKPTSPFGVALDGAGNLYTTDMTKQSVWAYTPEGKLLREFRVGDKPTGLAIDPRRQLLYVVVGVSQKTDHRVEVYSLTGQKLRTIGTRGPGPGQFNFPTNLAVAPDGNLYVVDMLNFRIQVFDPEGQLVTMFGQPGAGEPGSFDKAKAIALDTFGNAYVTDSQQGTVQIFNPKAQPLMAFAGRANALGFMLVPTAIAIDQSNHIFVSDYAAGVVSEYVLVNTTAADLFTPSEAPAGAGASPPGEAQRGEPPATPK